MINNGIINTFLCILPGLPSYFHRINSQKWVSWIRGYSEWKVCVVKWFSWKGWTLDTLMGSGVCLSLTGWYHICKSNGEKLKSHGDIPGSPVVKTALPSGCTGLIPGELGSHRPSGTAKRFKRRKKPKLKVMLLTTSLCRYHQTGVWVLWFSLPGTLWGFSGDFLPPWRRKVSFLILSTPFHFLFPIFSLYFWLDSQKFGL